MKSELKALSCDDDDEVVNEHSLVGEPLALLLSLDNSPFAASLLVFVSSLEGARREVVMETPLVSSNSDDWWK